MKKNRAEADLEARMHVALGEAFPWIANKLEHQTQFSIKLGHSTVRVDGRHSDRLIGRADILVSLEKRPLAILELKREGVALTDDDVNQGLSYARLTTPMTPLVVVSNGKDVRIHVTHSGDAWQPSERTEQSLRRRLESVVHVASSDVRDAVHVLMGADKTHWIAAVRSTSEQLVEDRTGDWGDPMAPFVRDFLFPRRATAQTISAINEGQRVVVVHGPPLSGKSNVVREVCAKTLSSHGVGVLMLEPGDAGVFASLSALLASALDWNVSADDAREWLRRISLGEDAVMVIALDGVDPTHAQVLADLNELAGSRFGPGLRLIVTVDDSALDGIAKKQSGRERTALGRAMREIPLSPLDDAEFKLALDVMAKHRIHLTPGGESVLALRHPWILRTLVPADVLELPVEQPGWVVRLPPLLDIESLQRTATAFAADSEAQAVLRSAAGAILDEYVESRKVAAVLHGITTFAVARHRLELAVGHTGMLELRKRGLLKAGINWAEQPVLYVRTPALVAMHVATVLAERMSDWGDSEEMAKRLVALAAKLPLGELIAAAAVVQRIVNRGGNDALDLLSALLQNAPTTSSLKPGSRLAFSIRGNVFEATVSDAGKLVVPTNGSVIEMDLGEGGLNDALSEPGGWLILSHIASVPLGFDLGEDEPARLDEPLLLEVGQSQVILSRPDGDQDFKEVVTHDIEGHGSLVCHLAGVVEPITWALVQYFIRRGPDASAWLDDAISKSSLPLIARIHIALRQVAGLSDGRGSWARSMLSDRVGPALSAFPMHD